MTTQQSIAIPHVAVIGGQVKTTSLQVAAFFEKQHKDVLKKIESLKADCGLEYHERNFAPMFQKVDIANGASRESKYFEITRNGFVLLVMGFTGKQAMQFKIAYINRFDEMEAALKQPKNQLSLKDGQHFVVAKDGVVLYHKILSQAVGKEALKSLNNTNALIEHIRQVMGEYIGKNQLPNVKQDKFNSLKNDLAHFLKPHDPYLQITYPTAQRALSMMIGILTILEQHGLKMDEMYQKLDYVKMLLTNYHTRLSEADLHLSIVKRLVSTTTHPTVVSGQGVKLG